MIFYHSEYIPELKCLTLCLIFKEQKSMTHCTEINDFSLVFQIYGCFSTIFKGIRIY